MNPTVPLRDCFAGLLVGTAVGDALGLPAEGLSPRRQRKWWPGELRHRFLFGRGMVSDDTEHAFMTAQALLEACGDTDRFRRSLAWQLRWWFLALPAGVGLATARACIRLWLGVSPECSGVRSAGNGPAMRSAIIGAVFADDGHRRKEFVLASTWLTHRDPRAETASLAVAEAAAWIVRTSRRDEALHGGEVRTPSAGAPSIARPDETRRVHSVQCLALRGAGRTGDAEWSRLCDQLEAAVQRRDSVETFAASLGLANGVTGYAYHTVPVALYAWLRHRGDFRATVTAAIRSGGDTDTVAAICGALAGCDVGPEGIPRE